jgi:ribosomal protein S18 acetylase RimI-like enzyme
MVLTAPPQSQSNSGPRPININKDIPQVMKLLELCFGAAIYGTGQQVFNNSRRQSSALMWRISPAATQLSLGYVWEENGRIIGNVTVLTTRNPGRYLVVNVAVHPEHRKQGIAKALMETVAKMVKSRNGREILLQVVKTNDAANYLYESLNYTNLGTMVAWYASLSRLRQIHPSDNAHDIRELSASEWQTAYYLDRAALNADLNWPEPPAKDMYKTNLWRTIGNFINGRQIETWVTHDQQDQLNGLSGIVTEWGRTHHGSVRIHPDWRGELERPLFAKLVRRLQYLPRRNIRIDHPESDELMTSLLKEANFQPQRYLTHMRLRL